jgi:Flp pilus assembly protein TadG
LVEFAMVLPIFLLILSAVCDGGFLLFNRMTVINAAREGARSAAMVNVAANIESTAKDAAKSSAASGGITLQDPIVTCQGLNGTSTINCTDAVVGDYVTVEAHSTYIGFFISPLLTGGTIDLNAKVQMVLDSIGGV